jgi:putative transcriptional regulator
VSLGRKLMSLSELLVRAGVTAEPRQLSGIVRVGGPVSPEQVWLVYESGQAPEGVEGQFEVGDGITACASRGMLDELAGGRAAKNLVGFAGYAGWAPEQLENEIRCGAWLPTDVEASLVFKVPSEELWEHAYARIGATPMAFVTRTVGSA